MDSRASNQREQRPTDPSDGLPRVDDTNFNIFEWYPKYQNCQRYFVRHAQFGLPVQALAAFLNILLPCQKDPIITSRRPNPDELASASRPGPAGRPVRGEDAAPNEIATPLLPYIRRLVVTGMDLPSVLHGFFGDDWQLGVGLLHEQERRNYLFAAKSEGWASVKRDYDIQPIETVPFLRPLQRAADAEMTGAERAWSRWLAMEDWMVGSKTPDSPSRDDP